MSDVQGVPFAVECKYIKTPPMQRWLTQARRQGRQEGKPWLLVVAGHNDPAPFVVMDFKTLAKLLTEEENHGLTSPD